MLKNNILKIGIISSILLFSFGCSTKTEIKRVEPVDIKKININTAVINFKNDKYNFTNDLKHNLSSIVLNNEHIYNMINNQSFENSIINNDINLSKTIGKDLNIEYIIVGEINFKKPIIKEYFDKRVGCINQDCSMINNYDIKCYNVKFEMETKLNLVDFNKSMSLYKDNHIINKEYKRCDFDKYRNFQDIKIPDKNIVAQLFIKDTLKYFSTKLNPDKSIHKVDIIRYLDGNTTEKQKLNFIESVKFIENNKLDEAIYILNNLSKDFNNNNNTINYNLGVLYEYKNNLIEAKKYYELANIKNLKNNDDRIEKALIRLNIKINEKSIK